MVPSLKLRTIQLYLEGLNVSFERHTILQTTSDACKMLKSYIVYDGQGVKEAGCLLQSKVALLFNA